MLLVDVLQIKKGKKKKSNNMVQIESTKFSNSVIYELMNMSCIRPYKKEKRNLIYFFI